MVSRDQIYDKVRETLVEALGVDENDVTPQATLVADLGAEPPDFVDIGHRLEKTFHMPNSCQDLFPENLPAVESAQVERGFVTEDGIESLREQLPHADVDKFAEDPRVDRIQDLFTVEMIVNHLTAELSER